MVVEDIDGDGDRDVITGGKTGLFLSENLMKVPRERRAHLMTDAIRFYERALQRLTRRELLNVAWRVGLAAVAQPHPLDTRVRAAALQKLSVSSRRRFGRSAA